MILISTRLANAAEFQGKGGPEDKVKQNQQIRPGDDNTLNLKES